MVAVIEERIDWRLIAIAWSLAVVLFYLPLVLHATGPLPSTDNDDLMRMVTATDLADGQGWQDRTEYRDNAPLGLPMHWSRLVDAPIAGLLVVLRPILGAAQASHLVPLIWPPLMLLGLLAVSAGLTRRLMGPGQQLPAVVLPLLSAVVLGEFSPGRVDHHNVQMILTTALVWATISGRTDRRAALLAGLLAATSLAIGVETLPFFVGAVAAFSLFWGGAPASGPNARRFALTFALGTAAHFFLATTPSRYFAPVCDELSAAYVVAAVLAALAIVAATLIGDRLPVIGRLALIGVLGGVAVAVTLALFPGCRAGPYGPIPPRAFELLLAHVPEAQPLLSRFMADPAAGVMFASASAVGLVVLVWCVLTTTGARRIDWLVLLGYLVLASIVLVMQVRGARLAVMPAMPAGVWLIDKARTAYQRRAGLGSGAALAASWLLFAGTAQAAAPALIAALVGGAPAHAATPPLPSVADCLLPATYEDLAGLAPGTVLAPLAIGPAILRYTPDSVVAAGYHRNVAGAYDVDDFLHAGEAAARAIATRRGLAYVATCSGLSEQSRRPADAPDSFAALAADGQHWPWLVPVSAPGEHLHIFRVEPSR